MKERMIKITAVLMVIAYVYAQVQFYSYLLAN